MLPNVKRIEVCGNIASGKSTFTKNFNENYIPLYEDYINNPFLEAFYNNPSKYSFETEITFLLLHYRSIKDTIGRGKPFICDFSIILDRAFAEVTLPDNRNDVFNLIADELERELGLPEKVIYIYCSVDILLERIKKRNRSFEKNITRKYLRDIDHAIEKQLTIYKDKIEIIRIGDNTK